MAQITVGNAQECAKQLRQVHKIWRAGIINSNIDFLPQKERCFFKMNDIVICAHDRHMNQSLAWKFTEDLMISSLNRDDVIRISRDIFNLGFRIPRECITEIRP